MAHLAQPLPLWWVSQHKRETGREKVLELQRWLWSGRPSRMMPADGACFPRSPGSGWGHSYWGVSKPRGPVHRGSSNRAVHPTPFTQESRFLALPETWGICPPGAHGNIWETEKCPLRGHHSPHLALLPHPAWPRLMTSQQEASGSLSSHSVPQVGQFNPRRVNPSLTSDVWLFVEGAGLAQTSPLGWPGPTWDSSDHQFPREHKTAAILAPHSPRRWTLRSTLDVAFVETCSLPASQL